MATRTLEPDMNDTQAILGELRARRWWLFVSVVLITAGFVVAAFVLTPIYRATSVLVASNVESGGSGGLSSALGQLGGLASLAGINIGSGDAQTQEALAVLQSREFTEAFIRDLDLMPRLYPDRWDANAKQWQGAQKSWPTLAQGYKYFDKRIRGVARDKLTGLVTLTIDWRDPAEAARWANELVRRINAEMRRRALARSSASVEYLEKELAATTVVETRRAINQLLEAQINQRMLANVTQEYAFRTVDRAMPPDPQDIYRPSRALLIIGGPIAGLLVGSFIVLGVAAFAPGARRNPSRFET